ncbi:MAG: hypothetical protein JWM61_3361, partial [Micrococcaceae bacterium]|nr:hypothetical protein [Micrococcaceae bacterium]
MTTLASDLLDFLMNLFNDADAANEFISDPEAALAQAGLSNVCMDDVDAVMPVVLDYAPVSFGGNNDSSFDRRYDTGGNSSGDVTPGAYTPGTGGGSTTTPGGGGGTTTPTTPGGGGTTTPTTPTTPGSPATGGDDNYHVNAVQQLMHVVNNYSYTSSVDDRDTITDQSVNQNIWANGDV